MNIFIAFGVVAVSMLTSQCVLTNSLSTLSYHSAKNREIMFTYAMSMLARYKVQHWNLLIEGKREEIICKIEEYLTSTQTLFPNLIYDQLLGAQYYFYPVEHELFQLPSGRPNRFPWIL